MFSDIMLHTGEKTMKYELIATSAFGLEAIVRREIEALGYEVLKTEDGRITFASDELGIARANIWLRTADRVYLKMGEFKAMTFEELFREIKAIPWASIIPKTAAFPVIGNCVKSKLMSVSSCQSIIKKAVIKSMSEEYGIDEFEEKDCECRIRFNVRKDVFTLGIDTTGAGLHKRGYRVMDTAAPIKETMAAALVKLSFWNKDKTLIDTCSGSGTILIEAAMIGRNIAPGLSRKFESETWEIFKQDEWTKARREAYQAIDYDSPLSIYGYDIEGDAIKASRMNAIEAGVIDDIVFLNKDMTEIDISKYHDYGVIITNPPYGERIGNIREIHRIYDKLRDISEENRTWSIFMITVDRDAEKYMGRKADRRRKLYNGRLETQYYQFHGIKPKR